MLKKSLAILFLFQLSLYSQEIVFDLSDQQLSTLDREKGILFQFSGDRLIKIETASFKRIAEKKIHAPVDFNYYEYRPIWQRGVLLLSEKDGGKLYALENDSLIRKDRSDIHNWQSYSSLINKNDTIYKYGGYGYWTTSNALTYFDPLSKGWEIVSFKSKTIPESSYAQIHSCIDNDLFIIGGFHINDHDRLHYFPLKAVWKYDFKSRSWSYLGESTIESLEAYKLIQTGTPKDFEIFNPQRGLIKIDPYQNLITHFSENPVYFNVAIDQNLPIFKYKGHYYYYNTSGQKLMLTKVSEKAFVPTEKVLGRLYANTQNKLYYLIIALVFLLMLFIGWGLYKNQKKKKKTLYVYAHKVRFNKKESFLEPAEYLVLKTLLTEKTLESAQLLSLIYNESLTKSHNEKIKNNLIDALNLKLSYVLGSDQRPITSEKSAEDKRIRVYCLKIPQTLLKLEK